MYLSNDRPFPPLDHMIDTVPWTNTTSSQLPTKKRKRQDNDGQEEKQEARANKKSKSEWSCYLLQSEQDERKFYIGSSPDPAHRLRQHNGEIGGGANETTEHRPWKQLAILRGFTGRSQACKYEKNAQDCDPQLVEAPQLTEKLHWFRKFLWPAHHLSYLKLRELCIKDQELQHAARKFKHDTDSQVQLSLQLAV